MPSYSRIELSNLALAKIRADTIAAYEENTLSAREVRRFYPQVMALVLAGPAEFSFANQRVALNTVTNTRDSEYLYAYSLPSNMASPIRIVPDFDTIGLGFPIPLLGDPYAETWGLTSYGDIAMPYQIEGSTLYCNVENAVLEYVLNDVAGLNIPDLVSDAIAAELGARLAVPIKGNTSREKELKTEAEVAMQRAIADDRNRHPNYSGQYVSETLLARSGAIS